MSDGQPTEDARGDARSPSVDVDTVRDTLQEHPVELAVLFGSTVTGTADAGSDVDIAIELAEDLDRSRSSVTMDVLVDLSVALDRNDIDLSLVEDLKPRVGLAAFDHGELLLGTEERADGHREAFARRVEEPSEDALRERLDEALASVDRHLGAGTR